jgi:signal transduction histidine kinase
MAKGAAPPPAEPTTATPDPAPAPMLIPAEPPMVPPAAGDEAVAPPLAVHLGTLRPQWLVGTDGTPLLVLVRTARVENKKTLYQGVVLDWAKLQALLLDEVKELFPDAKLEPRKDDSAESREQSMTALPVKLDTGADAPPPPAGWTPLRIGLVLAWAAAVVAFAAIGLSGWSLVDLADRRIRFVSAVTHELRTPLTSLRLYLDLLLSGMVQDEDKRREYLSTLNVESDRLHRLIDNVLDFAKLERSRKGRDLQPVKAADLLDSIRLTWMDRVAADGKELVVESSLPADLGITTDGSLVQQIVGNLIDNARKYTRDAADVRIRLRATLEGAKLVFEVEDRGCGVAPREQKTIFRPFRRGETADTKAGGAGLGLALSKEWAEVLGGRLTYRTPEGAVGSCFRLELPAKS